jgi:cation:H+ antiporter
LVKSLLVLILGLVGLTLGGKWIVDGAVHLATRFGMSQSLVGLTIVAVGNVVGSSIFNIFFVLGISSVIKPLPFQTKNNVDIGVVILASILLFFAMFTGKKRSLDRWEGIIFLALYAGYILFLIIQG